MIPGVTRKKQAVEPRNLAPGSLIRLASALDSDWRFPPKYCITAQRTLANLWVMSCQNWRHVDMRIKFRKDIVYDVLSLGETEPAQIEPMLIK